MGKRIKISAQKFLRVKKVPNRTKDLQKSTLGTAATLRHIYMKIFIRLIIFIMQHSLHWCANIRFCEQVRTKSVYPQKCIIFWYVLYGQNRILGQKLIL